MASKKRPSRPAACELEEVEMKISALQSRRQELRRQALLEERRQEAEILALVGRRVISAAAGEGWKAVDYQALFSRMEEALPLFRGCERDDGAVAAHVAHRDALRECEASFGDFAAESASGA